MRSFFSLFFSTLLVSLISISPVMAQSELTLSVTGPEQVDVGQSAVVVVEVTDADGPAAGISPEVTFEPGEAVTDEALYDCEDPSMFDSCKANHRGVAGIFEVAFEMAADEVAVEVKVGDLVETVKVGEEKAAKAAEDSKAAKDVLPVGNSEIRPEQIQAGPWPSFWMVIFPFVMMMVVVVSFVKGTVE